MEFFGVLTSRNMCANGKSSIRSTDSILRWQVKVADIRDPQKPEWSWGSSKNADGTLPHIVYWYSTI